MTVSAQTPINRSTGNGVTTVFPYTFKIISSADMEVSVDGVVKTLNVHYTVSGAGTDAGGNVTMTTAPANLTTVVRRRNMALVRTTDYQDQGTLPAATLDSDIDAAVLMVQQLDERLDRTVSLPASFSGDSTLPTPAPGYLIGWDATGENLTNIPASVGSSLVDLAASSGSTLVGHLPAGAGVAATTVQTQMRMLSRTTVYLKSTNTAAQNKTAFQTAIASMSRPGKLLLPDGFFACDPGIDLGTLVVSIEGGGKYGTYISNTGLTAATYFFGVSDVTLMEYLRFSEFGIDGGGAVTNGVRLALCNHSSFGNILITGTTNNAIYLGGYSNDIVETDLFSNAGNGITLAGVLNNTNVSSNKIYANGGVGVSLACSDVNAGLGININGNAIEGNLFAGITAFNTKGLNIKNNYFERNSVTGYTYGYPVAITILADIHLVAENGMLIATNDSYANHAPTISGNHTTPLGSAGVGTSNQDAFVFSSHSENLTVENNQVFDTTKLPQLVAQYQNRVYSRVVGGLSLSNNSLNTVGYIGTHNGASERLGTTHLIEDRNRAVSKNYADMNWLSWAGIAGSTGTLVRGALDYSGNPVFSLTDGDLQYAFGIDTTTNNAELRSQWVYFGMWVNTQGALTNARLFVAGNSSTGATDYDNTSTWKFKSVLAQISATPGITYFGLQKVGTGSELLVSSPVVSLVGTPYNAIQFPPTGWKATAAPTTGAWRVGDRVTRSVPVVGQPKAWSCTVAGAPGTWVSEGNL